MKVVVAIDSLKGSLTSMEAGKAVKKGILLAKPDAEVIVKPLADGGEGTTDALVEGLNGTRIPITVANPLGIPIATYYGYLGTTNTAVIEMASAAGLLLLSHEERNPLHATTYGLGEMIIDAINRGFRDFIIGIGGSATNDGGIGMLKALGFTFLDKYGNDVGEGGQALKKIDRISMTKMHPLLHQCRFQVACDVTNPLYGPNGATYIFGPQKGVSEDMKEELDLGMQNYAAVTAAVLGKDHAAIPGTGAAGGLGFAFLCFLNASLVAGIDLILNAINLEADLKNTDIVVTGEGQIDYQTSMGKAPIGVAQLAKKYNPHIKVLAFAGSVTKDANTCNAAGIDAFFPIVRGVSTLAEALDKKHAKANMIASVEQIFRIL